MITTIVKRDGRIVPFDSDLIESAISKCFASLGSKPSRPVHILVHEIVNILGAKYVQPTVEQVQDVVETMLQAAGEYRAAKSYILYRAEHAKLRQERPIPEDVRVAFAESDRYFPTELQKFQFYDKYSRFNYDLGRRETWVETVERAVSFLRELSGDNLPSEMYDRIRRAMLNMEATTSMRLLAMAGTAARRTNTVLYNCAYLPVDCLSSFEEALLLSMSGCGVGYSVERQYVENLPRIARQIGLSTVPVFTIPDSVEGWCQSLNFGLRQWFNGGDVSFDYSAIRPAGSPLKTKGGRASGEVPLRKMLDFARARILARQGGFLRPIDAHDIMCVIGNAAVSGGVRHTAMLSLFDFDDMEMRLCKSGANLIGNEQRWNANNSAVWPTHELTQAEVAEFMLDMVKSGRGEPGIFSRSAAWKTKPERRQEGEFGINPCVTGDTWIAVADGRGRARMSDLVADGCDVDVFTVKDGQVVIRTMRNPRLTGTQSPIVRVNFADGTYIRTTPNHKFIMLDGSEKDALDLQVNDSIRAMAVFSYKKDGSDTKKCNYDELGSYRMVRFSQHHQSEHRYVYSHNSGYPISGIEVNIHHIDGDGRNNRFDNLQLLTAVEHADLHRGRMLGQNNPAVRAMTDEWKHNLSVACTGAKNGNAKPITNEELESALIAQTQAQGRALSYAEYLSLAQKNNWPTSWTSYRIQHFGGGIADSLTRIAERLGLPAIPVTNLPSRRSNERTEVERVCEVCGNHFWVNIEQRELATCGEACSFEFRHRRLVESHSARKPAKQAQQVQVYNDLMAELNRHPLKKEWMDRCKERGISPEISRKSSPFRSWNALSETAGATNHRVVSVEIDGYENVYTGTVDDTHTFFSIGCERIDAKGRTDMGYVLSRQCGEIILRPLELCNLSIVIARSEDTFETLRDKVEIATIIGTIQSMATHFPGLRPEWQKNCEEERLLGVDINGQMDSALSRDPAVQSQLKQVVLETNRDIAQRLGINPSAATTCVKPSGNSSQLFDCSSGVHARWSPYYIRNVRVSTHTPLFKVLQDAGAPMDPENGQTAETADTFVIHFPVKAPTGAITRGDISALAQCEYWLQVKTRWTEHNPSVTITYGPEEVLDLIKWVWEHQAVIGGMSFLPLFDAGYDQMPYTEITHEEYEVLVGIFPSIDFSKLYRYEMEDFATAAQELACFAGSCEVDLTKTSR